tara:strand:- start:9409 stop:9705 length:297 start_codon:yes stop_codon:yes gene_type:complete
MNYQKMMEQMMRQQQQQSGQSSHPLAGLDINAATDVTCDNCGSMKFQITFLLKRVSPLVSPTGEEITLPIQTFSCQSCGWVNKAFVETGTDANGPSGQ